MKKTSCFILLLVFVLRGALAQKTQVAVYYFPNFHVNATNEKWHGKGWTEWDLVKAARPRFDGHLQPKVPTWGYFDEADPAWAAKEIDLAANNGIDAFIYDWYWYESIEGKKYLHEGLENGFLKAPNNQRLKFAIMWANHDWMNIEPTPYTNFQEKQADGTLNMEAWDRLTSYVIENYFKRPNYWKIDGKPYFSIFHTINFIKGFGSIEKAAEAIKLFDDKVKKAGFPGLHLNLIDQCIADLSVIQLFNVASVTSYNYVYAYDLAKAPFPKAVYNDAVEANLNYWPKIVGKLGKVPYIPNASMGWDVTPRLIQTDKFDSFRGYPWTPVFNGDNTPEAFKTALQKTKDFLDKNPSLPKIVTINAWNEWTEGSYLLPEAKYGEGYLKAIKEVFGK
jgi:hypothetical protein